MGSGEFVGNSRKNPCQSRRGKPAGVKKGAELTFHSDYRKPKGEFQGLQAALDIPKLGSLQRSGRTSTVFSAL
jgi:hypothetical protein